ncbi:MAG: reductive dehalogenase domain-containing protein [Alphaproteobacteria bacterium]|jgi:ferredoxin|nr:reductive dehalogenase domain-containing protein [Alphaproteobacteria bacterium]
MLFRTAAADRPYHLGPFPLEGLPRDEALIDIEAARPPVPPPGFAASPDGVLAKVLRDYLDIFIHTAKTEPAAAEAPAPDDPHRRMIDVKGYAYFMNASQVAICRIPANAWADGSEAEAHEYAVVLLLEHGRVPEAGNPARDWIAPAIEDAAAARIGGIAVCLSGHILKLGHPALAHVMGAGALDLDRLAVLAGLAVRDGGALRNPFVGSAFSIAAVSTSYELALDLPLAAGALNAKGLGYWLGRNGATSGRERNRRAKRASHLSAYPMETVSRVDRPTTLILDDEVPRVSKRAAFFERALRGDLGDKALKERNRFAFKQPHTSGMMASMRAMVPIQGGETNPDADPGAHADPAANARALKSLSYLLGADLTGICEVPRYAWFSHNSDGRPIEPYHKYAVVMLIDQEYDTMEGASGDDWISGTQSMRAYLRGAEIAGVMAETVRQFGFPARSQTNVDSDVLHMPLVLWAGLGELSRIGELVLNPFVGPRFKSVVLTTDMPLAPDRPIDFGLQYFCNNCWKCARECPCDAISWGSSVMFNGYEMWKPDAERCARYRLTNARGSACGRCMKTCPLNKVVTADGPLLERLASWCGVNARWLKPLLVPIAVWLDDYLGKGRRNTQKKWWLDLEVLDGVCVEPVKGANQRDLNLEHRIDPAKQKMAYYPAAAMPVPNDLNPQLVDRKVAMAAAAELETPAAAAARQARGEAAPAKYAPRPPDPDGPKGVHVKPSVYGGGTDGAGAAKG